MSCASTGGNASVVKAAASDDVSDLLGEVVTVAHTGIALRVPKGWEVVQNPGVIYLGPGLYDGGPPLFYLGGTEEEEFIDAHMEGNIVEDFSTAHGVQGKRIQSEDDEWGAILMYLLPHTTAPGIFVIAMCLAEAVRLGELCDEVAKSIHWLETGQVQSNEVSLSHLLPGDVDVQVVMMGCSSVDGVAALLNSHNIEDFAVRDADATRFILPCANVSLTLPGDWTLIHGGEKSLAVRGPAIEGLRPYFRYTIIPFSGDLSDHVDKAYQKLVEFLEDFASVRISKTPVKNSFATRDGMQVKQISFQMEPNNTAARQASTYYLFDQQHAQLMIITAGGALYEDQSFARLMNEIVESIKWLPTAPLGPREVQLKDKDMGFTISLPSGWDFHSSDENALNALGPEIDLIGGEGPIPVSPAMRFHLADGSFDAAVYVELANENTDPGFVPIVAAHIDAVSRNIDPAFEIFQRGQFSASKGVGVHFVTFHGAMENLPGGPFVAQKYYFIPNAEKTKVMVIRAMYQAQDFDYETIIDESVRTFEWMR